jgi:hypothetical protein
MQIQSLMANPARVIDEPISHRVALAHTQFLCMMQISMAPTTSDSYGVTAV